jgi:hypothetical protein
MGCSAVRANQSDVFRLSATDCVGAVLRKPITSGGIAANKYRLEFPGACALWFAKFRLMPRHWASRSGAAPGKGSAGLVAYLLTLVDVELRSSCLDPGRPSLHAHLRGLGPRDQVSLNCAHRRIERGLSAKASGSRASAKPIRMGVIPLLPPMPSYAVYHVSTSTRRT